jgi:hypothetical protein
MDIRDLALATALTKPVTKPNAGPWDWEAAYTMPNLGLASTFAAVASWLASKFTRPTVPALRAAHA